MTTLLVTHQPEDARRVADDIVFLEDGAVAAAGDNAVVLRKDGPEAFRRYIGLHREMSNHVNLPGSRHNLQLNGR